MTALTYRRDLTFYTGLFALWTVVMLSVHKDYRYFSTPLPSAPVDNAGPSVAQQSQLLTSSISELKRSIATEKNPREVPHIYHNIGTAFYDLYRAQRQQDLLDSARMYMERSISLQPSISRFYYNLGRLFTETGDHQRAAEQYRKALEVDPSHVLALHNLGLVTFFEFRQPGKAKLFLEKALLLQPVLPMCNYVLGEIAAEQNQLDQAVSRYQQEVETFARVTGGQPTNLPAEMSSMAYAASMSHLRLALLHSSTFINRARAQEHLHAYLRLEPDQAKRDEAIKQMQKYWVMQKD